MRCPRKSSVFAALLGVAVMLLGATAALADLEVSFVNVPGSVNVGDSFPITVKVTNTSTSTTKTFNRVAAGYALSDMRIKGPYEVYTTSHTLAPGGIVQFSFNFRIFYGTGTIVPVAVFLAQDSYQGDNMRGGGIVGLKVNSGTPQ